MLNSWRLYEEKPKLSEMSTSSAEAIDFRR